MHVAWIVEAKVCVRQVRLPKCLEALVVNFNDLAGPFDVSIDCITYVGTKPTSAKAKPFEGRYGLGLEHCI